MSNNDILLAQYPKQLAVRDRNSAGLLRWAAYVSAAAIPSTKPDATWVRSRIVADRMPEQIDGYVQRTLSYFLQDPAVTGNGNIYQWLSAFNSPDVEDELSVQNESIINAFIPRFALIDVSDEQVEAWYESHGFGTGGPP